MSRYDFCKIKILLSKVLIFIFSLLFLGQSGAEENPIEYKIKAGYLYNFTKFITWPEDEFDTFNLCILGKDPFGSIINPIEKRTVKNKPIRLFRIQRVRETEHCHIIYLSSLENNKVSLPGVLTIGSIGTSLTVGESKKFTQSGGMIAFFQYLGKVRLHINLQTLRDSGLEVSAKLLEVAELYEGDSND